MLQQTALMLVAGLIFLFFFTPDYAEPRAVNLVLTIPLLAIFTLVPGLLSYFFGKLAIRRLPSDRDKQIRQLQNSKRYTLFFGLVVLAGFVFEVYYLRLPIFVDTVFAFLKFSNVRSLIGMLPLIIAVLMTRLAAFELDRQVRNTSWTRRKFLALNLKLMLLPLSPFIVYLFIGDLVEHSPLSVRVFFIANSYLYWIIMLSIVAVMYINAPFFMRGIWTTHSLPAGNLRDRIENLAKRENIKYRDVLVWSTAGGRIANAGMAGLLPFARYIFLTDLLLSSFTTDEIETVAAHEFGHIKHRHVLLYLVFSIGYLVFYVLLYVRFLPIIEKLHLGTTYIALFSAAATLLAFYAYFVLIFRFLSRRFERQADLYAVESTGKPETFKSALIKLASVNYMPRRSPRFIEIFRTHPSVARRLEFVDRIVRGDASALKYRQPVFPLGRMAVLIVLVLSMLFIVNKEALFPPGDVHYEIGRQYANEGMIDEAITEFRSAVRVDPQNEQAHYVLGILYARKGINVDAIKEFEKALEINPRNKKAREALKQIQTVGNEPQIAL